MSIHQESGPHKSDKQNMGDHDKILHLIRHGQGEHNVYGEKDYAAYMSPEYLDAPLTSLGWSQCLSLRESLRNIPVDLIVTSPLMRTMQTTCGIFGAISSPSSPLLMADGAGRSTVGAISADADTPKIMAVESCRERMGVHPCDRRSSIEEYKILFPAIDFDEVKDNHDTLWKEHEREPYSDLLQRAQSFISWISSRPEPRIAVVSHSGFLKSITSLLEDGCSSEAKAGLQKGFKNCELRSFSLKIRGGNLEASLLPDVQQVS